MEILSTAFSRELWLWIKKSLVKCVSQVSVDWPVSGIVWDPSGAVSAARLPSVVVQSGVKCWQAADQLDTESGAIYGQYHHEEDVLLEWYPHYLYSVRRILAPVSLAFIKNHNWIFMEIWFYSHTNYNALITINHCTCHSSMAVLTCAIFVVI